MRKDSWYETLPVQLTDEEKDDRGRQSAGYVMDLVHHEAESKHVKAGLATKKKFLEKSAQHTARSSQTGIENRDIQVYESPDHIRQRINTIRTDTGEIVRYREMDANERKQPELFE